MSARALSRVSWYSAAGLESATMPAPACDRGLAVAHRDRPDGDAEVEVARRSPGTRRRRRTDPRRVGSSAPTICMARIFGAPVSVPAGNVATSASSRSRPSAEPALDAGHEVHDVRVALDGHVLRHLDAAHRRHAADVVAAEVDEHHVLGALLLVAPQFVGQLRDPRRASRRAAACRRSGASRGGVPSTRTSISGEAPTMASRPDPDEEHVRRRVDVAQRAVDVEGRGRRRRVETLREHRLVDLAGRDVFLDACARRPRTPRASGWPSPRGGAASAARRLRQVALELALEKLDLRARELVERRAGPRRRRSRALAIARIRCLT